VSASVIVSLVAIAVLMLVVVSKKAQLRLWDYAEVHSANHVGVFRPRNAAEICALLQALEQSGRVADIPVCVRGAGYSHGGNTLMEGSVQIDTRYMKRVTYDTATRSVTAESGAIWYDVLNVLAKHGRTVAEMQSYHNFSVGGSIAVNCHGRGTRFGAISETVVSLRLVDARGRLLQCDDTNNRDLFYGTMGGYSLLGVVADVTLITVPNDILEPRVIVDDRHDGNYDHLTRVRSLVEHARRDPAVVLFNATLYPPDYVSYGSVVGHYWVRVPPDDDEEECKPALTSSALKVSPIQPRYVYCLHMLGEQLVRRIPVLQRVRARLEQPLWLGLSGYCRGVERRLLRSYALASDANALHGFVRFPTTTVLQEYFVPLDNLDAFLRRAIPIFGRANVVNASVRYVKRIERSVLNYAPVDSASVVLYINVWNTQAGMRDYRVWTDAVLRVLSERDVQGRFYLPYVLAYDPGAWKKIHGNSWETLMHLKAKYDPRNRFRNMMFEHVQHDAKQ